MPVEHQCSALEGVMAPGAASMVASTQGLPGTAESSASRPWGPGCRACRPPGKAFQASISNRVSQFRLPAPRGSARPAPAERRPKRSCSKYTSARRRGTKCRRRPWSIFKLAETAVYEVVRPFDTLGFPHAAAHDFLHGPARCEPSLPGLSVRTRQDARLLCALALGTGGLRHGRGGHRLPGGPARGFGGSAAGPERGLPVARSPGPARHRGGGHRTAGGPVHRTRVYRLQGSHRGETGAAPHGAGSSGCPGLLAGDRGPRLRRGQPLLGLRRCLPARAHRGRPNRRPTDSGGDDPRQ